MIHSRLNATSWAVLTAWALLMLSSTLSLVPSRSYAVKTTSPETQNEIKNDYFPYEKSEEVPARTPKSSDVRNSRAANAKPNYPTNIKVCKTLQNRVMCNETAATLNLNNEHATLLGD